MSRLKSSALARQLLAATEKFLLLGAAVRTLWALAFACAAFYLARWVDHVMPAVPTFTVRPWHLVLLPALAAVFYAAGRAARLAALNSLVYTFEQEKPELRDQLVTALEILEGRASMTSGSMSARFAEKLEQDMTSLLEERGFGREISARKLLAPAILLVAFLLWIVLHGLLWPAFFVDRPAGSPPAWRLPRWQFRAKPAASLPDFKLEVSPGSCRIPAESSLQVQARTGSYVARSVRLEMRAGGQESWRILAMNASGDGSFHQLIPQVTRGFEYLVRADHKASETFEVELFHPLRLEEARWDLDFPDYLRGTDESRSGWKEKLVVPQGTRVGVQMVFNRPVGSAFLANAQGQSVNLAPVKAGHMAGEFVAEREASFTLIAESRGDFLMGSAPCRLVVIPDLPPYLEVKMPLAENYIFATEEVPFEVYSSDDYGLARLDFVVQWRDRKLVLPLLAAGGLPKDTRVHFRFPFERTDVRPGDLAIAYIEAADANPARGAGTRSSLFFFAIRDFYDIYKPLEKPEENVTLRDLFDPILIEQKKEMEEAWDILTAEGAQVPS